MLYPVFLDLRGLRCVVVGGGPAVEEKVRALVDAGARVVVVGWETTPLLQAWTDEGHVEMLGRPYRRGDLEGAWLVIAASADRSVNQAVWEEAEERRIFVNAVDDPPHCRFLAGAVHRQGDLIIAISTSGKAPALAVRLRDQLAATFGPEYAEFLRLAGDVRQEVAQTVPDAAARRALWYRIADSDVLQSLRASDPVGARDRIWALVREAQGS